MHRAIMPFTAALLVSAVLFASLGLVRRPGFESASTLFALVAAVLGLVIDRWVSDRERRRELLRSLVHEVYMNLNVLGEYCGASTENRAMKIHSRFYASVLQVAFASGAFSRPADRTLFKLMGDWLQRSIDFNQRLLAMEIDLILRPGEENVARWEGALRSKAVLRETRESLTSLAHWLMSRYSRLTEISSETVLFESSDNDGTTLAKLAERTRKLWEELNTGPSWARTRRRAQDEWHSLRRRLARAPRR